MNHPLTLSDSVERVTAFQPLRLCIHQKFEVQVQQSPGAVALSFGSETISYADLNARANRLAHRLRTLGVGPEVRVALYLERTPLMVVAILGVLKAGGCYVPIDLAYPMDRAAFMMEDAQAAVLLTQEKFRSTLPSGSARVLALDTDWPDLERESAANPETNVEANGAAYVIYTSGSTGKPKGVIVTHHNVVRLLEQTQPWYQFHASDVWPLFHSYAFDVSVWELWGSLFNGGRLVVVPYLVTRSPGEFYELLSREGVTVLNQTPSAFRQLIWAEATAPRQLPLALRYVICAGEALELQSLKPWFERHGDEQPRIVNMYGITETTVHSTFRIIRAADLTSGVGSVIGVPIPDLQLHLVDEELRPVPKGSPGEICVGGAGVARGYLNRPELTAKRFLPDPFSSDPGARLYRSGDLAQYNDQGELEYLGRMDHQVKIRGFRVELGEIESALNRHPGVRESVVIARETAKGDKRLVAYIVPGETPPSVTDLRHHVLATLPDYMTPTVFVFMPGFPLTTNGKIDRRALPAPDGARPELQTPFVAPRSPAEATLARIWSEVLEVERVGVKDNLFELGGDSIRSITILSKAQQAGLGLTLEQVFRRPTIEALAAAVGTAAASASRRTEPFSLLSAGDRELLPKDAEDAYPISKLQLGMFFRNELNPASAIYHDVFSYHVSLPFDRQKLADALALLVRRHPLLRTSFHLAGYSEPVQIVHREAVAPLTVEDVRKLVPEEQSRAVVTWIEAEKRRPFDRATAPLVRFHVQVQGPGSFQLIFSFHHSCLDGWSLAAAITEVFQDYTDLLESKQPKISSPGASYRDFVALEREAIVSADQRAFWSAEISGASLNLLSRWPRSLCSGGLEQNRGPEVLVRDEVLAGLRRLAQSAGVPLKSVLLAAHQRVMSFLYGQNDVTSALISNGRPEEVDGERIIGLFLNAMPVRLNLTGGSWLDLVRQTFAAEQRLLPYRRFPLAEVHKLNGGRPLFETAFDFVHFHVYKSLQGRQAIDLKEGHYFEANDLTTYTTFMLDVNSARLELHIDYEPNVICRDQVAQMTQYYLATLEAMAADSDARYELFTPLSGAERAKLLVEWNATAADYPRERIHELFEKKVAESPDASAVVFGGKRVTYFELNSLANRIAAHLRDLGAKPGSLVGICLERSVEMVAGLLGILKTGAAYVPLDPAYPTERIAFMVRDSALHILLTSEVLEPLCPRGSAQVVCLEDMALCEPAGNLQETAGSADDLAYVIYTSGSTGQPKGVQITHRSVVNLLESAADKLRFTGADNLLAVTTLSFDIAALELFTPLVTGARLTIASREAAADGLQLSSLLESSHATIMQATPATWRLLLESGWNGSSDLKIICGGEALKAALAAELLAHSAEVWNFYGPTETTIWSTAAKVAQDDLVTIGHPLANTQLYILDSLLRPVPVGAVGELHIGGDGLARGYLNRPELTAEKFVANPFVSGARIYKTGDLARFLPDGSVECLGRVDHQVKVRGFRIEPGEIENALRQYPAVAEALVTAREDHFGDKRLVGYVVSRNGPPSVTQLREHLRTRLPHHMVPAQFVVLKSFPLTPNGKVNVSALPAPEAQDGSSVSRTLPRTELEKALAGIFQEVLELKEVGIEDNFFDLGGDSLSATRAYARINRSFGANLSLREMLDRPTVAGLADLVKSGPAVFSPVQPQIKRQPRSFDRA